MTPRFPIVPSGPGWPRARRFLQRTLAAMAVAGAALLAGAAHADFRPILVDGALADWAGLAPVHVDPTGDAAGAALDLGGLWVANDDRYVYLRFEIGALRNLPALPAPLRIFLDTDASIATGYLTRGIGADLVIECSGTGSGIQAWEGTPADSHATFIGHAPLALYHGPTVAATTFEMRIARQASLPISGRDAFPGATFRAAMTVTSGGAAVERLPDVAGGVTCVIEGGAPPAPVSLDLARADPWHARLVSWNVLFDAPLGPDSTRFRRVLQALSPDVIAFQEFFSTSGGLIAAWLNRSLPLGPGPGWQVLKGSSGQALASRYPLTLEAGAPSRMTGGRVDLPNDRYSTDLFAVSAHLKCCGAVGTSEDQQRQASADATIAWLRDLRTPGGVATLPFGTPVVIAGDFNLVGGPQPLTTFLTGDIVDQGAHGADSAPDWDGTSFVSAAPIHAHALSAYTWRSAGSSFAPGMLDYALVSDAVCGIGRRFVLDTSEMPADVRAMWGLQAGDTDASDHLPVVVDLSPGEPITSGVGAPAATNPDIAPNPMRFRARILFDMPRAGRASVMLHDISGRRVRRLHDGPLGAGPQRLWWDGRDDDGRPAPSGIYLMVLEVAEGAAGRTTRRIVVTR